MDDVIVIGLLAVFVALWVAAIAAVVSAIRVGQERWWRANRSKGATILLLILTGGFGGVYYWWRIRPELRSAHMSTSRPESVTPTKAQRRAIEAQRYLGR